MRLMFALPFQSRFGRAAVPLLGAVLLLVCLGMRRDIRLVPDVRSLGLSSHARRPDIVLVTIDSLRADHVGSYGYARPTTPHLDRLARRGLRFERAYTQAPHTSFSITSLLTGRQFGTLTRLQPAARFETLATRLAANGFATAAIYPPAVYVNDAEQLAPYQATHFGFKHVRHDYLSADQIVDEATRFLDQKKTEPTFVWLHLFEPHEPYQPGGAPSFGSSDMDCYDQEIVVADAAVGRLLRYLDASRPDAAIIVTSDHGEAFDEHGERYHGTNLHEEQVRVPLIVRAPGLIPQSVRAPVALVDVFPTILGLTGLASGPPLDGQDLRALVAAEPGEPRAVFAALEDRRMIVRGEQKLIWDLRRDTSQVFDLSTDPHELHDLATLATGPEHAALTRSLRADLDAWIETQLRAVRGVPELPAPLLRARLGDAGTVDALAALMADGRDRGVRDEAARLLLRMPPRMSTLPRLLSLHDRADPALDAWASVAALRLGHRAVQAQVLGIVRDATLDFELRLHAAAALAWRSVREAAPAIVGLLDGCPDTVRCREVVVALGRLGDGSAVPALLQRIADPMVQREVIGALGRIATPETVAPLAERLLHDERSLARMEAARALGRIRDADAQAALVQAAAADPELRVRDTASAALALQDAPADAPSLPLGQ